MAKRKLSLSSRIFIYMIMLVVVASILIAGVTIYQYNEQSQDYHRLRLERKEAQLISSINYVLKETTWEELSQKPPRGSESSLFGFYATLLLKMCPENVLRSV